jgi:hypothetical protein
MNSRDEFAEAIKVVVSRRVGSKCSNPDCRALTSGPQEDPAKCTNIGVAAHITAAAPGGPRYDASLSVAHRRHAENAIWLCQNCGKLIDNDPIRFPELVLREWKRNAEAAAVQELGKTRSVASIDPIGQQLRQLIGRSFLITPTIPSHRHFPSYQQFPFQLVSEEDNTFKFQRRSTVDLRRDLVIRIVPQGPAPQSVTLVIDGRLQWLEPKEEWEYRPEIPRTDEERTIGFSKISSLNDGRVRELTGLFANRKQLGWVGLPRLPHLLSQGWEVFYDDDGYYFRAADRPYDQVLVVKRS